MKINLNNCRIYPVTNYHSIPIDQNWLYEDDPYGPFVNWLDWPEDDFFEYPDDENYEDWYDYLDPYDWLE